MSPPVSRLSGMTDAELAKLAGSKEITRESNDARILLERRRGFDKLVNDAKFRANGGAKVHTNAIAGQTDPYCDQLAKKADQAKSAALDKNANEITNVANANPGWRSGLAPFLGGTPGPGELQMLELGRAKSNLEGSTPSSFLSIDDQVRYHKCEHQWDAEKSAQDKLDAANNSTGPGHDAAVKQATQDLVAARNNQSSIGAQPVTGVDRVAQRAAGATEALSMFPMEGPSQVGSFLHAGVSVVRGDYGDAAGDVPGMIGGGPVTDLLKGAKKGLTAAKDAGKARRAEQGEQAAAGAARDDASVAPRREAEGQGTKCKCPL